MGESPAELLVVVPARGKSRRLPGKHLRPLAGRTLLERTQDAIAEAGLGCPVLLTTDDPGIAAHGRTLGWLVPFLRPAALAADETPTAPVVLHALDWFAASRGGDPALVMVLQPTSPLRRGAHLAAGLARLAQAPEAEAVVGVRALPFGAGYVFVEDAEGYLRPVVEEAAQGGARASVMVPNGALYLVRSSALRRHETLYPPRALALVMDEIASVDIDTAADWQIAEALLETREDARAARPHIVPS